MFFEPRDYLRHIMVEADCLIRESAGISEQRFLNDETLQRAFVRSLEIIGEATKRSRTNSEYGIHKSNGAPWRVCEIGSFMIISAWITSLFGM